MCGGRPPALLTIGALLEALAQRPSRKDVALWVEHWDGLDLFCGEGHSLGLEEALFDAVASQGSCSFRAAWTLALLTESGAVQSSGYADRLYVLLNGSDSLPVQRELLRALLFLPWSDAQLGDLTQWALHMVFVDGAPPSAVHQSLKVMERCIGSELGAGSLELRRDLLESLSHVVRIAASPHTKKKAALLRARLSE